MAKAKKRKKFFDVDMPIIGKQTQLQAFETKELDGKYIKYDLTRIMKGKSVMLQLKVQATEDKATSVPTELRLLPNYLRRMMRKGTDYVEDSFSTKCKDRRKIKKDEPDFYDYVMRKVLKKHRNRILLKPGKRGPPKGYLENKVVSQSTRKGCFPSFLNFLVRKRI